MALRASGRPAENKRTDGFGFGAWMAGGMALDRLKEAAESIMNCMTSQNTSGCFAVWRALETDVHIGSSNPVRAHAHALGPSLRPGLCFSWDSQPGFLPLDYSRVSKGAEGLLAYNLLAGFGLLNLMFGMMVRFSRDSTAFMILVIAAAPSLCPRFGLTWEVLEKKEGKKRALGQDLRPLGMHHADRSSAKWPPPRSDPQPACRYHGLPP